jgi:hypothetical protein
VRINYNSDEFNDDTRIEIISIFGQVVYNERIVRNKRNPITDINISGLSNGIYIIRLVSRNEFYARQLIKI